MGDPAIGSAIGGYHVDALIARGGMGIVYRATHQALQRPVALKVIGRHLAQDPEFRDRFLRESQLAARLEHRSIVPVYDAREEDGELIVAMRLVEGGDMKRRISTSGPLPPAEAVALLGQVAEALDVAHAEGVVHRDVKPHNILLEGERAFLTDFGLAKALGDSGVLSGASIAGTVEYMAPEQWRGERVGPAADIYSLGCVLYEAVTGIAPYARRESEAEPEMPAGLDAVVLTAVEADPGRRWDSAGALIEAARECEGATPAATRVLSEAPERPTIALGAGGAPGPRDRLAALGPRRLALAALVPLLALAAAAYFLLIATGDDVSVSPPVAVGEPPLRLAAGQGGVWVTSAVEGTVSRLDPAGGGLSGPPLEVGRGVSGVAVGRDSVWVSVPPRGEVLRIDPDGGGVLSRFEVGGRPGALAIGGGRVWTADERGAGITAIDPVHHRVLRRRIAPRVAPLRLAVGAGALWASSASTGSVRRIDLDTALAGTPIRAGRGPAGITVGGGLVWVANSRADAVSRIDPPLLSIVGTPVAVGERPGGIDAGTEVVWVANSGDGTVTGIEIASGDPIGDPIDVGPEPGAVAVGREAVWVANNGDGTVTRIEP